MGVGLGGQGLQGSGLAFGGPQAGLGGHTERAKDARSAYVETIEDVSHLLNTSASKLTDRSKLLPGPTRPLPGERHQLPCHLLPRMVLVKPLNLHTMIPLEPLEHPHKRKKLTRSRMIECIRACPTEQSEPKLAPHIRLLNTNPDLRKMLGL